MIAPYYFYYAHYYAALAIGFLPPEQQPEYRAKYLDVLFGVQEDSGGWNDRVFPRSENFGTSMAILSLQLFQEPATVRPAAWKGSGTRAENGR